MRRHLTTIALASGILASSPVDAVDQYKVVVPASSTLSPAPRAGPDATVQFRGVATLPVTYRFIYDPDDGGRFGLVFMPDRTALERLPYLIERAQPDRPTEIFVLNPKDAATALLSGQLASQLRAGKHKEVSGRAIVVIGDFSASYDCDSPTFTARFLLLQQMIAAASATSAQSKEGC